MTAQVRVCVLMAGVSATRDSTEQIAQDASTAPTVLDETRVVRMTVQAMGRAKSQLLLRRVHLLRVQGLLTSKALKNATVQVVLPVRTVVHTCAQEKSSRRTVRQWLLAQVTVRAMMQMAAVTV